MTNEILISIQKPHTDNMKALLKEVEVRKDKPKQKPPFTCYIYETKAKGGCGKVIGEFTCDKISRIERVQTICDEKKLRYRGVPLSKTCLTIEELNKYLGEKDGYCWYISDLKLYARKKELRQFYKPCPDKYQYCQGCEHGSIILSPDEEEYALYHGGQYDYFETVCHYVVTRPPRSWCYVDTTPRD